MPSVRSVITSLVGNVEGIFTDGFVTPPLALGSVPLVALELVALVALEGLLLPQLASSARQRMETGRKRRIPVTLSEVLCAAVRARAHPHDSTELAGEGALIVVTALRGDLRHRMVSGSQASDCLFEA